MSEKEEGPELLSETAWTATYDNAAQDMDSEAASRRFMTAMKLERAQQLERENNLNIKRLEAEGIQIGNIDGLRWAVLLDMLFGDGESEGRVHYELTVQETLAAQLAGAKSQVARAKLTAPLQQAPPASMPTNGARLILPPRG
jgi:hypothetical protein